MELVKENIFDLLGTDSRKYHSAILTSFSFDFSFFETRAMRALKGAGVRNILVLIDEQTLIELMEKPSGMEFRRNYGYGIYPVDAPGVFHPKILFCSGVIEGFLAIGSGNLTAAGHGSNDELWSVFHFKSADSANAHIFSQAWNYLLTITSALSGNAADKVFRMSRFSPWIHELPKSDLSNFAFIGPDEVALLPVYEGDDKMNTIFGFLNKNLVREVKVLSPYFEKDGLLLKNLRETFPKASIKVVVDTNFGVLPVNLESTNIEFHNWQSVYSEKGDEISRLHGKLIVFSLNNEEELIVSGSSNASTAAFGVHGKKAKNKELNVIFRRKKSDVFQKMGLNLTTNSLISLNDFKDKQAPDIFDRPPVFEGLITVKHAEILGAEISLVSRGSVNKMICLKVYDRERRLLETSQPLTFQNKCTIKLNQVAELPFFACWANEAGDRVSNFVLIQDTAIHLKTNPDPSTERLESLFDNIEKGNFGQVAELLSLVSFVDEEDASPKAAFRAGTINAERIDKNTEYGVAPTYEEFTQLSDEHLLKQKGLLLSPNVRIAEFLSIIKRKQMPILDEDVLSRESQVTDTDNTDGDDEDIQRERSAYLNIPRFNELRKEKNSVYNYLKNYHKHLSQRTAPYLDTSYLKDFKPSAITLHDYSNLLIAIHLVKNYTAKRIEYIENEKIKSDVFLSLTGDKPFNNQKSFLLCILPQFLLLAEQGIITYEHESSQNKLFAFRKEAFFNIIFLISNTPWNNQELPWVKSILLNAAHITIKNTKVSVSNMLKDLNDWIKKVLDSDLFKSFRLIEDYNSNLKKILKPAIESLDALRVGRKTIVPTDSLQQGEYIYNSKLGICLIKKVKDGQQADQWELVLMKPGFKWDETEKDWVFRHEFKKNVHVNIK